MIKSLIPALLLLVSVGDLHAAEAPVVTTQASAPSAEARALAEKVLVAMRTETSMKASMETVRRSMSGMTHTMIGEAVGNELKPGDLESMKAAQTAAVNIVEKELTWDRLKADLITLYAETYTDAELRAMLAFYTSPEGITILDKTPIATARSIEIVQKRMADIMPKILAETQKHTDAIRSSRHTHQHADGAHDHAH